MDLEIHLNTGETVRAYDALAETPELALKLLLKATQMRPDWVRVGNVVVWSGAIAYVRSVDPSTAQEDPQ